MKRLHEEDAYDRISARVVEMCRERGISGVFAMAEVRSFAIRYTFVLTPLPLRENVEGKRDCNFMAVAMSKLAMVVTRKKHTGGETNCIGEVPYMGGRLSADGEFAYAFSGAEQEVDDELMQLAEQFHASI